MTLATTLQVKSVPELLNEFARFRCVSQASQNRPYMKLRVWSDESAAASSGVKPRRSQALAAAVVHVAAGARPRRRDRARSAAGSQQPAASRTSASKTSSLRPAVWASAAWRRSIAAARRSRSVGLLGDVALRGARARTRRGAPRPARRAGRPRACTDRARDRAGTTAATGSCPRRAPTSRNARDREVGLVEQRRERGLAARGRERRARCGAGARGA